MARIGPETAIATASVRCSPRFFGTSSPMTRWRMVMIAKPTTRARVCARAVKRPCAGKAACSDRSMSVAKAGSPTQPIPREVRVTPNCTVPR
jgi:hypothetical protein